MEDAVHWGNRKTKVTSALKSASPGLFEVIHEDADLLVVNKPSDLVCHPTKDGEHSSLIGRLRIHLGNAGGCKPHLVHRLDRETSGLVLAAKNSMAAGELGKIWETRAVRKEYHAIVHGHVLAGQGIIDAPLGRNETSRVAIQDCVRPDGNAAQTEFFVEKRFSANVGLRVSSGRPEHRVATPFSLVRLRPLTGRKHQIRIHLAHLGHPIVGDKLYGGDPDLYLALVEKRLNDEQRARLILPRHALHAGRIQFNWRGHEYDFVAAPETAFTEFILSGNPL